MNLALVGATGSIGSGVLDEALRRGNKVPTRRASP